MHGLAKRPTDNNAYQQLIDGTLWDAYCDALKLAGQHLRRDESPRDAFNQAEGVRYLTRMVRAGLESLVESTEAEFPRFADPATSYIKIGADNPDNRYMTARMRGHHTCKLTGHRGTVANINFATKGGGFQKSNKTMAGTGFLAGQVICLRQRLFLVQGGDVMTAGKVCLGQLPHLKAAFGQRL